MSSPHADRMEVEHAAKRLIRQAVQPSGAFQGLEEPAVPLPHSVKADMAFRPHGCKEDLWLAVQVKSAATLKISGTSSYCEFQRVGHYREMLIICVVLHGDGSKAGGCLEGGLKSSWSSPRAWAFEGPSLGHLKTNLRIISGGKYDTPESRCTFTNTSVAPGSRPLADVLLSAYLNARSSSENTSSGIHLRPLDYLRNQVGASIQTEMETRRWLTQVLFDPAGMVMEDAPCSSLPYDTVARPLCGEASASPFLKVQLKTAYWRRQSKWGPMARVNSFRKCGHRGSLPYVRGDFDVFLVGPPRNKSRLLALQTKGDNRESPFQGSEMHFPSLFYMFLSSDMEELGFLTSGEKNGKCGFDLDFIEDRRHRSGSRTAELLPWRHDLTERSLQKALERLNSKFPGKFTSVK
uniref:Uncharacterized protein n=1 Tax=Chromera velia CCMP2878 TaxID=1169474 RepID=A0A0G4HFW7_9ALVE|eukprot:Cvel_6651.t1-p1 / transcript=Cvel_6651.t1 / gene=Cvel_6651 / organism=Chromera_velia_CCMP2878 / gene_product=hypothetical protein / transcript_product=hypothetical protein / location=Cvel_scaffold330:25528-26745(-) / protein_length=406 / sequence_SO=supercontig / SO=protein_coding / is_pseudo=false